MKTVFKTATAALMLAGVASPLAAHDYKAGDLVIDHPWTRATPPGAGVAGGYAVIKNVGDAPDMLIGGSFDAAERVEIHEMAVVDDVMRMRELPEGLEIPPGGSVTLKPGGYHVMFMGLERKLDEGAKIAGALEFARAGTVAVVFNVEALNARGEAHGGGHDHSAHGQGESAKAHGGHDHSHSHSHSHEHSHGAHGHDHGSGE